MHPEIVRDGPGACPICGMSLEPQTATIEEEANPELVDMSRRFWVSVMFSVPLLVIAMTYVTNRGGLTRRPEVLQCLAVPTVFNFGCLYRFETQEWIDCDLRPIRRISRELSWTFPASAHSDPAVIELRPHP
jgi:hypothetical protein